jgi:hypothetical protein
MKPLAKFWTRKVRSEGVAERVGFLLGPRCGKGQHGTVQQTQAKVNALKERVDSMGQPIQRNKRRPRL